MLNLIIFGSPGAGKGTQAQLVAKDFNLKHISSGELLRMAALDLERSESISKYLEQGYLVPDQVVSDLVSEEIKKYINTDGLILDGYPRTIAQAKFLDSLFSELELESPKAIKLDLEETIAIERIMSRAKYSSRSDDQLKVISTRLETYKQQTKPLVDYYRDLGRLISIDGRPDPETVNKSIREKIKLPGTALK